MCADGDQVGRVIGDRFQDTVNVKVGLDPRLDRHIVRHERSQLIANTTEQRLHRIGRIAPLDVTERRVREQRRQHVQQCQRAAVTEEKQRRLCRADAGW